MAHPVGPDQVLNRSRLLNELQLFFETKFEYLTDICIHLFLVMKSSSKIRLKYKQSKMTDCQNLEKNFVIIINEVTQFLTPLITLF